MINPLLEARAEICKKNPWFFGVMSLVWTCLGTITKDIIEDKKKSSEIN